MEAVAAAEAGGQHSLAATLDAVLTFLRTPLHPCEHCDTNYKIVGQQNHERWSAIEAYMPQRRHPWLFDPTTCWADDSFDPRFLALLKSAEPITTERLVAIGQHVAPGVVAFPMLSERWCAAVLEEMDSYTSSGLPIRRPNSMNNCETASQTFRSRAQPQSR